MSALNNFIHYMLTSHPLSSGLGVEVGVPFSAQVPLLWSELQKWPWQLGKHLLSLGTVRAWMGKFPIRNAPEKEKKVRVSKIPCINIWDLSQQGCYCPVGWLSLWPKSPELCQQSARGLCRGQSRTVLTMNTGIVSYYFPIQGSCKTNIIWWTNILFKLKF